MRLLKYWKNLRKMLLFTRAIRKNASSTLSAASVSYTHLTLPTKA